MVPRDQGWFKIDTIVTYFFPGSGGSGILPLATPQQGRVGRRVGHTRAREVRRHADEFQAGRTSAEFVELQSILLHDAGLPGLGRRGSDPRDVRSRKRWTIGGEAGEGGGADAEEGEEEESLVLRAVIIAARVMLLNPSDEAKEKLTRAPVDPSGPLHPLWVPACCSSLDF